jgi:hypothetical protein
LSWTVKESVPETRSSSPSNAGKAVTIAPAAGQIVAQHGHQTRLLRQRLVDLHEIGRTAPVHHRIFAFGQQLGRGLHERLAAVRVAALGTLQVAPVAALSLGADSTPMVCITGYCR